MGEHSKKLPNTQQIFEKVIELEEGQSFGELALMNTNNRRAATINCIEDCYFAVMDKRTFDIIQQSHQNVIDRKIEIIKEVPFFSKNTKMTL